MRKVVSIFALASLFFISAQQQTTPSQNPGTDLKFTVETHDFGDIVEGTQAKFVFNFTNIGKEPVTIQNVQASCGCTSPSYTQTPILPKEQGNVTAVYDSNNRLGNFTKSLTVFTNTGKYVLYIKGNVVQKVEKPKSPVMIGN